MENATSQFTTCAAQCHEGFSGPLVRIVSKGRREVKTHPVEALPETAHRRAGLRGLYLAYEDSYDDRPRAREANDEYVEENDDGPFACRSG